MKNHSIKNLCLFHIADGLRQGLSQFSGTSRVALIYAEKFDDPIRIYDPHDLLRGHEPKLEEIYLSSEDWRLSAPDTKKIKFSGELYPEKNLELSGLISYGGRTGKIFYQMWFTEHHPAICSIGPTERWLEYTVSLLSQSFSFEDTFYPVTSSHALREYATHAVRDHIYDELSRVFGWDTKIFVFPILDAILGISKTMEEGAWPRGNIVFVSPNDLSRVQFLINFPRNERPALKNLKHVRKLLQTVENSDRKLISFGKNIFGVATGEMPNRNSTADFRGEYGFISVGGNLVCSFSDGKVYSSNQRPVLVDLEETLLESHLPASTIHELYQILTEIVNKARLQRHGCAVIIDLNDQPIEISGQPLEYPIDLGQSQYLELAKSLAKVDGALHVGADLHMHGFACLMDGRAVSSEDRARGARYNSALRFTAEHKNIIVVVVSSDKPVSVIRDGIELTARCDWESLAKLSSTPPTLNNWIKMNGTDYE
jgi:hypothetical protein